MNTPLEDFDRIHRLGKPTPGRVRPVLVKFATYQIRDRVYAARSRLKPADARNPDAPWKPLPANSNHTLDPTEYPGLNTEATPFNPIPDSDNSAATANTGNGHLNTDNGTLDSGLSTTTDIPAKIVKAIEKKIFLNDDLTSKRDFMLFVARQAKRKNLINDVWVINGMIKMKDINNTVLSVRELKDIPDQESIVKEAEAKRTRSGPPKR